MSYILDALKRNASDAQVGDVPSLHTQAGIDQAKLRSTWWQPAVALLLIAGGLSFWLQPWTRQPEPAEMQIVEAPEPRVVVLDVIDYSDYQPRSPIVVPVIAPQPAKPVVELPREPVNAGIADGEQEPLVAADEQEERLGGDALAALFKQAVEATHDASPQAQQEAATADVVPLTRKSQSFQNQVPVMEFSAHSYSSDPRKRMVKVNGNEIQEGGWINDSVQVVAILPNKVVMEMQGEQFTLPALSDW
ncbi:general secretion pathway protein GspB [Neiella marina]|uniref:General secretion pathway protein GspB n=1 Tax=Neiella holothuriorum TaxID=2870530 RepID=A0ABS7EBJ2_9GAMM|nr:general secretion pathway protein GspB [Neiella holothuriorum]MBW8189696.1 general secretion pathway protein GspB [Neiella holothuriorum]